MCVGQGVVGVRLPGGVGPGCDRVFQINLETLKLRAIAGLHWLPSVIDGGSCTFSCPFLII